MAKRKKMTVRYEDSSDGGKIYMAMDLGGSSWMVGFLLPGDRDARLYRLLSGDKTGLLELLARQRERVGDALRAVESCYEAGRDGFWLDRWLRAQGISNRVLDPASIEVPRRRRRVKTDRVDTVGLLRVLLRLERGETELTRVVHVPEPGLEDARRRSRERERLVRERTAHRNRIQALLATQGIKGIKGQRIGAPSWLDRLSDLVTGDGRTLGPWLLQEIRREAERLLLVEDQIKAVEASQRAAMAEAGALAAGARRLMRLKGLGLCFSNGLMQEAFWRDFRNRRQVGGSFGLVPWPWESGEMQHDQPISKAGNRRARSLAIECAWMWVIHQPQSSLTLWWKERFAESGSRQRRIGIVALARKLMVALWRYLREGLVPEGALFKEARA